MYDYGVTFFMLSRSIIDPDSGMMVVESMHACLIRMEVERMLDPDGGRKNGCSGWRWKACLIRMEVESMLDLDGGGKHA